MADVAVIDTIRSLDFSGISGTFAVVGTAFEHPVHVVVFTNNTDGDLFISLDGVNNQLFIAAGGFKLFDLTTNRSDYNSTWTLPKGTQIYIKQSTAPTTGTFYVECIYQRGK